MLKRKIAVLIAGGLLGAQVTLAAADQTAYFPSNDTEVIWKLFPAQVKYLEERAASVRAERVVPSQATFPSNDTEVIWKLLPAQAKYLEQRAASIAMAAREDVYPRIKIASSTKYVTAEHLGTVKFVNDKGQSFVWRADTLAETKLPLKAIAPAGFDAGDTVIYVRHPAAHIPG